MVVDGTVVTVVEDLCSARIGISCMHISYRFVVRLKSGLMEFKLDFD
jgi:hypothetical protein